MEHSDGQQPNGASSDSNSLKDELRRVFTDAKLPSNPAIATQILELVNDPNTTAQQFAEVIQTDVALAARLLEMANAARFAQRNPATTIQRAVTILGLRRIRMVALGFQLVSYLDRIGDCPFDLKKFWQQSALRACLGREFATIIAPDHAEEAFLIGLLQDCGILPLVQLYGAEYGELCSQTDLSPTAFYKTECEQFEHNHVEAIGVMARNWKLPEVIAKPLSQHHTPLKLDANSSELDRLCAMTYFLGSMRLRCEQEDSKAEMVLRMYARETLELTDKHLEECFAKAAESYRQIAPLLKDQLPGNLDVTDILEAANRLLTNVATETEEHLQAAEAEREEVLEQQDHLKHALGQYREKAARDPLTGLLNRAALLDQATEWIRHDGANGSPLAVFFLDLDNFKRLNDDHGHERGDQVLQWVSDALSVSLPENGLAGRYGGEEFVIILPGLTEDAALKQAKKVADAIRGLDYVRLRLAQPVTCSLGAVWLRCTAETVPQQLIASADELMYQAKRSGKDRCCFKSLEPNDPGDVLTLYPDTASPAGRIGTTGSENADAAFDDKTVFQIAKELNELPSDRLASARKQERRDMVVPCMVVSFIQDETHLRYDRACLRNISTGGLGVLVTQPFGRGEPIEVAISKKPNETPKLFVAGLVAFCRHVREGVYDLGIQIVTQSKTPIFKPNLPVAEQGLDWVSEAISAEAETPDDLKESA